MLQLLRRVPVRSNDGMLVGRELGGATVGLIGMPPAARPLAELLARLRLRRSRATTRRCTQSDGAVGSAGRSSRWACASWCEQSDVVCVLLNYFTPLQGPARRALPARTASPTRCWSAWRHSSLFDEAALAEVLDIGPHGRGLVRQHGAGHARLRAGRCTASTTCRSRRAWPAPRANRASAAPGRWRGASTRSSARRRRAPSSGRRPKTTRLISKPVKRPPEVREPLLLLSPPPRPARAPRSSGCQLGLALPISPSRRAISLARRARSASTSIATSSASRGLALHRHRRGRAWPRRRLPSSSGCTSDSLASAFSTGAAEAMNSASPLHQQRHALGR